MESVAANQGLICGKSFIERSFIGHFVAAGLDVFEFSVPYGSLGVYPSEESFSEPFSRSFRGSWGKTGGVSTGQFGGVF